jgi:hypothetical protein
MRRGTGRLLLAAAAALPLSAGLWNQPAQAAGSADGTAVMKCMHFKDAMIITPGLSKTPTDQKVAAHGRVYGCNKVGGGGKFSASLTMTAASCANRRFLGTAKFAWTNGLTSTATLAFLPAATSPRKVEVLGTITDGPFQGLLLHSWVRISDTFKGSGPGCEPRNLLKRIEFSNSQSLQILSPITTTTTAPQHHETSTVPATHPPTTATVRPQGSTATNAVVPVTRATNGGGGTNRPGGSLAFTGNSSRGALLGLESLLLGGAIWALGGRRDRRDRTGGRRRRTARRSLYVTLPAERSDSL